MAGVKGRSGGPRPNSGGARPGAGRKPAPREVSEVSSSDPEAFLRAIIADVGVDARLRVDAAKALLPYCKAKVGEAGKKEQAQEAAKDATSAGRFAPAERPRLIVNNG